MIAAAVLMLVAQFDCEPRIDRYSPYLARMRYEALARVGQLQGSEFDTYSQRPHTNARLVRRMAGVQYRRRLRGQFPSPIDPIEPAQPTQEQIDAEINRKLKEMDDRQRRIDELDRQLQESSKDVDKSADSK